MIHIGNKLSDFIQREADVEHDNGYNFNVHDIIEVPHGYWIIINNSPVPTSWAIYYYSVGIQHYHEGAELEEELYLIAEADMDLEWELVSMYE
jgi:hypothetical protein